MFSGIGPCSDGETQVLTQEGGSGEQSWMERRREQVEKEDRVGRVERRDGKS